MAKLTGPLLSFGAQGSLAKSVTFTKSRTANIAKAHSVPTNPNSTGQAAQRSKISQASSAIQALRSAAYQPLIAADVDAWDRLSKALPRPVTWYNSLVSMYVNVLVSGGNPAVFTSWGGTYVGPNISAQLRCSLVGTAELDAATWFYGLSPHSLIASIASSFNVPTNLCNRQLVPLASSAWHFIQLRPDSGQTSFGSYSGIYAVWVP